MAPPTDGVAGAYARSSHSGFITLKPELSRTVDKLAVCSLFGSTIVALFLTVLAWFSLGVSYRDDTDTEYGTALYISLGLLCLFCALFGFYTVFTTSTWCTLAFALVNAAIAIVVFSVALADITAEDCEESPSPTDACATPIQHTIGWVTFLFLLMGVLWCSVRVYRLKKSKQYFELLAGGPTREEDRMEAISVVSLESDTDNSELTFDRI